MRQDIDRKLFNELRKRGLSASELFRMCVICDIKISLRSIQNYLDNNFATCSEDRIKVIAEELIKNHDTFVKSLKAKIG